VPQEEEHRQQHVASDRDPVPSDKMEKMLVATYHLVAVPLPVAAVVRRLRQVEEEPGTCLVVLVGLLQLQVAGVGTFQGQEVVVVADQRHLEAFCGEKEKINTSQIVSKYHS
jgi:hypothetical protein